MKLSILSGSFGRFSIDKQFEMVKNIGFDGIDICGTRPHAYPYDMDQRRIDHILELKEKYKLETPMFNPELLQYPYNISSVYENERRDTIDYLLRSIEVANALGIGQMQITCGHPGYDVPRALALENTVKTLREVMPYAEDKKVDVVLEPLTVMESNTIVMLDSAVELIKEVNSPRLVGMIDSAMVMTNWEPVDVYFEKFGSLLRYIHWGDSNGTAENHLHIGAGRMDPLGFFQAVKRRGYDGWVSIEMFSQYIREPEMHAAREHRLLREIFSQL